MVVNPTRIVVISNKPILFSKNSLKRKNGITKALIAIGSTADQYTSLGKIYLNASTLQELPIKGHSWKTTLKVISYVLTAFIPFILAYIAKSIYRNWAVKTINEAIRVKEEAQPKVQNQLNPEVPKKEENPELKAAIDELKNLASSIDSQTLGPIKVPVEKKETEQKINHEIDSQTLEPIKVPIEKKDTEQKINHESEENQKKDAWIGHFIQRPPEEKSEKENIKRTPKVEEKKLSSEEIKAAIDEHLGQLSKEESDEQKIIHLLELERLSKLEDSKFDTFSGKMIEDMLFPEPPKMSELVDKKTTGQIFTLYNYSKPIMPGKFIDMQTFVDCMLQKILEANYTTFSKLIKNLTNEQKFIITDKFNKIRNSGQLNDKLLKANGRKPVLVRSESGRRVYRLLSPEVDAHINMNVVSKKEFFKSDKDKDQQNRQNIDEILEDLKDVGTFVQKD